MTPMYFRNSTSIGQNINAIHGSSNGDIPSTLSSLYTAKNTIDFYLKIRSNDFPKGLFINKRGDGGNWLVFRKWDRQNNKKNLPVFYSPLHRCTYYENRNNFEKKSGVLLEYVKTEGGVWM